MRRRIRRSGFGFVRRAHQGVPIDTQLEGLLRGAGRGGGADAFALLTYFICARRQPRGTVRGLSHIVFIVLYALAAILTIIELAAGFFYGFL